MQGRHPRILRTVHAWKDKLGAVNASTALHLLAQSSQSTDALPRLHQESAELVLSTVGGNAQPRDLAIASWAAAKLRLERAGCADTALQALNIAALACAARMDGQDMANIAWAFATMQLQAEELLTVLAEEASAKLQQFEPKHMVVLTWALAKAKVRSEDFCWAAASETQRSKASKWMPQDISNFLWANAVLRCEAPVPMEILAARAADLHWKQFRPQDRQDVGMCNIRRQASGGARHSTKLKLGKGCERIPPCSGRHFLSRSCPSRCGPHILWECTAEGPPLAL